MSPGQEDFIRAKLDTPSARIIADIIREVQRSQQLAEDGKFEHTPAMKGCTNLESMTILGEEVGEVAMAINAQAAAVFGQELPAIRMAQENLREELVQVAAVAVSWLLRLDSFGE